MFRQAQNDLAFFVESMIETHEFTGPWIAFGGSYPGSMVAWAREKYPHLIKGGVSSSGPLLAKVNIIFLALAIACAMELSITFRNLYYNFPVCLCLSV